MIQTNELGLGEKSSLVDRLIKGQSRVQQKYEHRGWLDIKDARRFSEIFKHVFSSSLDLIEIGIP